MFNWIWGRIAYAFYWFYAAIASIVNNFWDYIAAELQGVWTWINENILGPQRRPKLLPAQNFIGLTDQNLQCPKWELLDVDPFPASSDFSGGEVHLENTEAHDLASCGLVRGDAHTHGNSKV